MVYIKQWQRYCSSSWFIRARLQTKAFFEQQNVMPLRFPFSLDTLWSYQSICSEADAAEAGESACRSDVFSLPSLLYWVHLHSFKCLFSSLLRAGSTHGNEFSYEVKYEISGTELLMPFSIAHKMDFPQKKVCMKFPQSSACVICNFCF